MVTERHTPTNFPFSIPVVQKCLQFVLGKAELILAVSQRIPYDTNQSMVCLINPHSTCTVRIATGARTVSLIGELSFAAKFTPAAKIILRRLIEISMSVKELHHHIALTGSPRADIKWWKDLLSRWKAVSLVLQDDGSKQLT